jgi:hypothetical protein
MVAGFVEKEPQDNGFTLLENDLTDIPPVPDYCKTINKVSWSA